MKIFLVCNSLGGGGAERVHVNLANGFAQRGHEVYLIADIYKNVTYPVDEKVHVLPLCPRTTNKLLKWVKSVSMLRKNVKKYKPDVVIGNMDLCSVISRISTLFSSTPVVFANHHALESQAYKIKMQTKLSDCILPRFVSATTLLTAADKKYMARKYHQQKNIFVMPNPLTFTPVETIPTKENIIFAAGRLNNWRYKGWDILINAAEKLKPLLIEKGWMIQIAGGGTEKESEFLEVLCQQAGAGDVIEFLGYRTDMEVLFQKASIYCLSSRTEGLPMVLIEAMSQGCAPVACENLDRTKEIITNETEGLLFETANIEDLVEKLTKMIVDDEYRQKVQKCAVKRSQYYLPENIICEWEKLFQQILH